MIVRLSKIIAVVITLAAVFGASAYLTLTLLVESEQTVVVPDLVGKDTVQVLQMLSGLGLNTKVNGAEFSDTIPKNHVVFQEPLPGAEIKSGRSVQIVISKGARTVTVPNLSGLTRQEVRLILEDNGLCLGNVSLMYAETTDADLVIAQTPRAGETAARGGCIDILISAGARPALYRMPDVTGRNLDEAVDIIEKSDLRLGQVQPVVQNHVADNAVFQQEPSAGQPIAAGTAVRLLVNRLNATNGAADAAGTGFIRHRIQEGFLKRHIRVHMEGYGLSGDLVNRFAAPGEEVWVLVPFPGVTQIRLYEDGQPIPAMGVD